MKKCLYRIGLVVVFVFSVSMVNAGEEVNFSSEISSSFTEPVDVAVNASGDMFILDKQDAKVYVYNQDGKLKLSFGEKGSQLGEMFKPNSIALLHSGEIVIADTGNDRILVFDQNGRFKDQLGNSGSKEGEFLDPVAVAVDQWSHIYVADARKKTITQFSPRGVFLEVRQLGISPTDIAFDRQQSLYILNVRDGKVVKVPHQHGKIKEFVLNENGHDLFSSSSSLAVDGRGDLYVMDSVRHSLIKFDQGSNIILSFGSKGIGKGQFDHPRGITVDNFDRIYIADSRNQRVQIFEMLGSEKSDLSETAFHPPKVEYEDSIYLGERLVDLQSSKGWGLFGLSDRNGHIMRVGENLKQVLGKSDDNSTEMRVPPKAFVVRDDGKLIVADTGNHQIQFLNDKGEYIYKFGHKGEERSQFYGLSGIAVDRDGYLYVADTKNHRIQVFNSDGIYLRMFGSKSVDIDENGAKPGTFVQPRDLVFNSREELYVLDYQNRRIQIFSKDGRYLKEIGGVLDSVRFDDPIDMDLDENDYLYVVDKGDHSVKVIDPEGQLALKFGSIGNGPSHFPNLSSITVDDGKIYVADYDVESVQVFRYQTSSSNIAEKVFFTETMKPLKMKSATVEVNQKMARKLLLKKLKKGVLNQSSLSVSELGSHVSIEEETWLDSGELRITISIPKNMLNQQQAKLLD